MTVSTTNWKGCPLEPGVRDWPPWEAEGDLDMDMEYPVPDLASASPTHHSACGALDSPEAGQIFIAHLTVPKVLGIPP